MAIQSIRADLGVAGANGIVFLGGTTALNLLGAASAAVGVPAAWKAKLDEFLGGGQNSSLMLGGKKIIKTGYYVKVEGMEFEENDHHGSSGPAYWEMAKNVAGTDKVALARKMRAVLAAPSTSCNDWEATLIAAMFLSEVVRNPRSFMINLMLLDLIEGGVRYGSANNKELDFNKLLVFGGGGDKTKTYTYAGGDMASSKGATGTLRGGKLPMSQKDAMQQYQSGVSGFEYKTKFDACAKQSALNLQAPASAGAGYHFATPLLEKECTVALRWLLAFFTRTPLRHKTGTQPQVVQIPGAWGKPPTTATVQQDVTVPITLTGLRDQVRNAAWIDAETGDARATALKTSVSRAFKARQEGVQALL